MTTAPLTTVTVATPAATTVPPATTTVAPTVPAGGTSWWFPYFLGALVLLLLVAGAGVWWAIRTPGAADAPKAGPRKSGGTPPSNKVGPAGRSPAPRIALDRVRAWDPGTGRVAALETTLRDLEKTEQARSGSKAVDLLELVPPARIPSRPMPEPVRRWGARVGLRPALDRPVRRRPLLLAESRARAEPAS